ncbi:MAG: 50S ribosomal protein L3 [Candidatus Aenigmatarchaeota archaeon]|nr:50S ribosomal protein L3 [Candidatus Aenigmarchaeota archaeon]
MPEVKKPREGSKGYWPRKRSIRIYPNITTYPESDKPKIMGFAGYKAGMLHAILFDNRKGSLTFGQEISVPVTVIDCPPLKVIGVRVYQNSVDGLRVLSEAIIKDLPKDLSRKIKVGNFKTEEKLAEMEKNINKISRVRLIVSTQPRLSGVRKKTPEIFELEIGGKDVKEKLEFAKSMLNKEITAKDFVREGELVDVISVTKGKGTAGPVKRFGVKIQVRHAKKKLRHVGSLGQERPGKVRWSVPMAGQLGFFRRTELNKRVLRIGDGDITPKGGFVRYGVVKGNYILLEGSVPGSKKRLVLMRHVIRPPKLRFYLPEIREIVK